MALYDTVSIVGVGLIGGSIGKALRERRLARRIIGVGRTRTNLDDAIQVGAIDEARASLEEGVADSEVVVVCTPVPQIAQTVCQAARSAPAGVLVTDAGSTKRTIVESVEGDSAARGVFVAAHPIAGSERKGSVFSDPDLFQGRVCVLTPTERTPQDRAQRARAFWEQLGCRLVTLSPSDHDAALALTSHLPHAVAAALAAAIPTEYLSLAAGAYRDGTRVAGSDGELWTGIFLANRGPLLDSLSRFQTELATFRDALERKDDQSIRAWWASARDHRARYGQSEPIQH